MIKKKITESMLAEAFEKALHDKNHFNGFPVFKLICKEMPCQQGIADFIATTGPIPSLNLMNKATENLHSTESSARIMSLLCFSSPRTKKYIIKKSGLTSKTVSKILKSLLSKGYISKKKSDMHYLASALKQGPSEFWAFELKLNDWKRALFQALQYKAFANRVMLVFPPEKERILKNNIDKFKRMKVGVMTFDIKTRSYKMLLKPRKNKPASRAHNLFLFSKMISLNGNNMAE